MKIENLWRHFPGGNIGRAVARQVLRNCAVQIGEKTIVAIDKKTGLPLGELALHSIAPNADLSLLTPSQDMASQATNALNSIKF